ncbi:MAG: NADH:ubiquinone reductase (Na(+)-transporting) subunit A [Chlorobi bacterium]|nr:NADH:ubiquinone reductase (Na(+)-transporting) subunit A [Chlorobiota bacterium]
MAYPVIKLKRGYDLLIEGEAEEKIIPLPETPTTVAIKPTDFLGIRPIPKLLKKEGSIKAGEPLFYDKDYGEELTWTAPASGEIAEIRRGPKRRIEAIVILLDKEQDYYEHEATLDNADSVRKALLSSGLWALMVQRPYGLVPRPDEKPDAIFMSMFDTHPLAPRLEFLVKDYEEDFLAGWEALKKLADGLPIFLGYSAERPHEDIFLSLNGENIRKYFFSGPHPSGNVGVHIHHVFPTYKGSRKIWTIKPQYLVWWGRLFRKGIIDLTTKIALTAHEVKEPAFYETIAGVNVKALLKDQLKNDHVRVISGNVFTGTKIDMEKGHVSIKDNMVTVIPEGDFPEFQGWLITHYPKPSISRTFLSGILYHLGIPVRYKVNTKMHGERRPFVVTGEYEQVTPMDLYPQHLLKAIIVKDLDLMEQLGIHEVIEEDLALCEFVCTSKTPVQKILREGIELFRHEVG